MPLTAAVVGILSDLADELLQAVIDAFDAVNIDLPSRQYVHTGSIADDCGQLVVSLTSILPGDVGVTQQGNTLRQLRQQHGGVDTRTAVFTVRLVRCVGSADSPSPPDTTLDAEAEARLDDAMTLVHGLVTADARGEFTGCDRIAVGECTAVGPQGGMAGFEVAVYATLT